MVLLVVDTQTGIIDERLFAFETFKRNVVTLIETARSSGVEVVYVRHDDGPGSGFSFGDDAFEIYEGFAPKEGEQIFDKTVNSAFHDATGLTTYLRSKKTEKVIVVGLQTDFCIDATVKSGFEKGFEMIVPAYCNSTRNNSYMDAEAAYRYYNEFMWPRRYANCVSVEEALAMMREYRSQEPDFSTEDIRPCGLTRKSRI